VEAADGAFRGFMAVIWVLWGATAIDPKAINPVHSNGSISSNPCMPQPGLEGCFSNCN